MRNNSNRRRERHEGAVAARCSRMSARGDDDGCRIYLALPLALGAAASLLRLQRSPREA